MSSDARYHVYRSDGWAASSTLSLVSELVSMPVGATATVHQSGRSNNDSSGTAVVTHVVDGWVVYSELNPEPMWVSVLRQSLTEFGNQDSIADF